MSEPLGAAIDNLGVTCDRDDGELIDAAIVILRVVSPEGHTHVRCAFSEGLDWITRRGLLEVALDVERIPPQ
jgi:hypothetical protein